MVERSSNLELITGVPAIGKSAIGKELVRRGYDVVDNDHSDFQSWGKQGAFKPDASVLWMFRNPPRWREDKLPELRKEDETRFVSGWFPGVLATLKHFDRTYYLSPKLDFDLMMERIRERDDKTFGSTDGQIVTSLIAAAAMEAVMRVAALFKKNLIILDAHNSIEQNASTIAKDSGVSTVKK